MQKQLLTIGIGATKVVEGHAVTRWAADVFEVGTWGKSRMSAEQAERTIIPLNTDEHGSRLYPVEFKGERRWVTVPE